MRMALLPERGIVRIAGPEARPFLHNLVSNAVEDLAPGRAVYAALLSPQGKVLFDVLIVADGEALLIDCERRRAGDLVKRLTLYKLRAKVTIADESADWRIAALWGAGAPAALALAERPGAARPFEGGVALVDPRHAELGVRLLLPAAATAPAFPDLAARLGLGLATIEDYTDHRFALGIGEGAAELGIEALFLLEANAEALHGVDFRKGCYVGQELTARMKHRSTLRKRLMPARIDGAAPTPGAAIVAGDRVVGAVCAAHRGRALVLARLDALAAARAGGLTLEADGARLAVETPDWLAAAIGRDVPDVAAGTPG